MWALVADAALLALVSCATIVTGTHEGGTWNAKGSRVRYYSAGGSSVVEELPRASWGESYGAEEASSWVKKRSRGGQGEGERDGSAPSLISWRSQEEEGAVAGASWVNKRSQGGEGVDVSMDNLPDHLGEHDDPEEPTEGPAEVAAGGGVDVEAMSQSDFDEMLLRESYEGDKERSQRTRAEINRAGHLRQRMAEGLPLICYEDCAASLWRNDAGAAADAARCHANCCIGCTVALAPMVNNKVFMGEIANFGSGFSGSEIFWARRHDGRKAFVKFRCIPGGGSAKPHYSKPTLTGPEQRDKCSAYLSRSRGYQGTANLIRHQQLVEKGHRKLATECGVEQLSTEVWVEEVVSNFPGLNVPIKQMGLFSEPAGGIDLHHLTVHDDFANTSHRILSQIPSEKIVTLAVHDLLFSQNDRHQSNVFVTAGGEIKLIDNDRSLGYDRKGKKRTVDSIFLPGTVNFELLLKHERQRPLDVRCHTKDPGGAIGHDYPPGLERCMRKFMGMSVRALQHNYGLYMPEMAAQLKLRASDMILYGFEGALERALEGDRALYHQLMKEAEAEGREAVLFTTKRYTLYRPSRERQCGWGAGGRGEDVL